jgi:hypothetical protein
MIERPKDDKLGKPRRIPDEQVVDAMKKLPRNLDPDNPSLEHPEYPEDPANALTVNLSGPDNDPNDPVELLLRDEIDAEEAERRLRGGDKTD